jgi:hypothetical protein
MFALKKERAARARISRGGGMLVQARLALCLSRSSGKLRCSRRLSPPAQDHRAGSSRSTARDRRDVALLVAFQFIIFSEVP